jgi:RNA recognition motif-containing protein
MAEAPAKNTEVTIYVGNLGYEVTEDELKTLFKDCGKIKEVRIIKNREQRPKGFAYIEFENKDAVQKAQKTMNDKEFKGLQIKVDQAGEPRRIRGPNEPNPASSTVFVGNLAYECTEAEITKTFATCGVIKTARVMMNPATGKCRGFAYIEFNTEAEATKALTLNSQEIMGRPIKVDFAAPPHTRVRRTFRGGRGAPRGAFRGAPRAVGEASAPRGGLPARRPSGRRGGAVGGAARPHAPQDELQIPLDNKSVFAGNLPEDITPERLHEALSSCGTVTNIQMATLDNKPRGFAYVHFSTEAEAARAIAQNRKISISGKEIKLEETRQSRPPRAPRPQPAASTTVHVAGLPREMTPADVEKVLREKFGSAGQIASVNPVVSENRFVGYAYISYSTIEGATAATAITNIEMEGRKLRVSYALPVNERSAPRRGSFRGRGRGRGAFRGASE